jgi:hypothetical protein
MRSQQATLGNRVGDAGPSVPSKRATIPSFACRMASHFSRKAVNRWAQAAASAKTASRARRLPPRERTGFASRLLLTGLAMSRETVVPGGSRAQLLAPSPGYRRLVLAHRDQRPTLELVRGRRCGPDAPPDPPSHLGRLHAGSTAEDGEPGIGPVFGLSAARSRLDRVASWMLTGPSERTAHARSLTRAPGTS